MTLRVLDLFSGVGGFSLGLERAGMKTVAFCEIDPYCRAVLKKHWPDVPRHEDVRDLRASDVGSVDVICAGWPCQDGSRANYVWGAREGVYGARTGLWREILRIADELGRPILVLENTTDLLDNEWFGVILRSLAAIGYDAEWHCIPAAGLGAPHIRDRLIIVAHADSERCKGLSEIIDGVTTAAEVGAWGAFAGRAYAAISDRGWSEPVPAICRMDDEFSEPMDAIAALGNAVVPLKIEVVGRAIVAAHEAGAS